VNFNCNLLYAKHKKKVHKFNVFCYKLTLLSSLAILLICIISLPLLRQRQVYHPYIVDCVSDSLLLVLFMLIKKEKVIIFIDGSNLYHELINNFGKANLNFEKFAGFLAGKNRLVQVYYLRKYCVV